MLLNSCAHQIESPFIKNVQEIYGHLEWELCKNTQLFVVNRQNICWASLPLDYLQGYLYLLDHLGLALALNLVKSWVDLLVLRHEVNILI